MRTQLTKIMLTAIAASFTFSTTFAANLPKNCTDEIVGISKGSGFDMQKFTSDLPTAVAKAKLQAKVPFGKPKDSDKTDIGMTFGCLKVFPESPSEILSLLKDVAQVAAVGAVANQLGVGQEAPQQAQEQPQQQIQPQYQYPPQYAQPYYPPPPQAQPQCPKCECNCNCGSQADNFTAGERWGTWALNWLIPGLGSAAIMNDYVGMGIQLALTGFGVISIVALGTESYSYDNPHSASGYCREYDMYGNCNYYGINYNYTSYGEGTRETVFTPIGWALLGINFMFNIARSNSYNKPVNEYNNRGYSSNDYSGFNLAVLPNKRGEAMPYVMYNKTF